MRPGEVDVLPFFDQGLTTPGDVWGRARCHFDLSSWYETAGGAIIDDRMIVLSYHIANERRDLEYLAHIFSSFP